MAGAGQSIAERSVPHSVLDDLQALVGGAMLVSLGVTLMNSAGLVTGGVAGLCLLLHYATGIGFGKIFLVLSLPFYAFALRKLGWRFTLKTLGAVLNAVQLRLNGIFILSL